MDSAAGGGAVYTVAISRPTRLYLGAAEVSGQWDHLFILMLYFDLTFGTGGKWILKFGEHVFFSLVGRLVLIRKPGSLQGYLFS